MTEPQRILENESEDAAALLLRSARADRAPTGGKARALAALGLGAVDSPKIERSARREAVIVLRANQAIATIARRRPKSAAPLLFQSVLAPAEQSSGFFGKGRESAALVAGVQAVLLVVFLLAQPGRRADPPPVAATPRGINVDMMLPAGAPPPPAQAPADMAAHAPAPAKAHAWQAHSKAAEPRVSEPASEISVGEAVAAAAESEPVKPPPPVFSEPNLAHQAEVKAAVPLPSASITRPRRLAGRDPQYTREAREARVEGTAVVQCVVDVSGATRDCKVVQSLPHMEDELLAAARTWQFSPATSGGRAIAITSSFTITLVLPKN